MCDPTHVFRFEVNKQFGGASRCCIGTHPARTGRKNDTKGRMFENPAAYEHSMVTAHVKMYFKKSLSHSEQVEMETK